GGERVQVERARAYDAGPEFAADGQREDPVPAVEAGPQLAEHRLLERSGVAADPLHAERRLAAAGEGARGRESPVRSQYFLEHDLVGRVDVVVERDRLPP